MRCLFIGLISLFAFGCANDTTTLTHVETGTSAKLGYYSPIRVELTDAPPATLTKAPDGLLAPRYGIIVVSGAKDRTFHVIIDEPEGKDARLFVDTNGDGDLTNDPAAEWTPRKSAAKKEKDGDPEPKEYTTYNGGATLLLGASGATFPAHIKAYRFDKTDPARVALANVVLYYRDYGVEGIAELDEKTYAIMLEDSAVSGDFSGKSSPDATKVRFLIDVNNNGKFEHKGESFPITEPFNVGGTTWELADIASDGTSLRIEKSEKTVEAIAPPPDLAVGKKILAFDAKTMAGASVRFPSDFKGKVVLLDFWATWCGPCMKEMPNVVAAYETYHGRGFDILAVTLDNPKADEKIATVTKNSNMTWPQIYDGGGWKAAIAVQFAINSIPRAYLVDGDTGTILATGDSVRGEQLAKSIEAALEKRKKVATR